MRIDQQHAQDGSWRDGGEAGNGTAGNYEPPQIRVLGTLSELTHGAQPGGSDGLVGGSVLH
jgi:hypothetical protein